MLGNGHVRFGRRAAEPDQSKDRHRAAARPHTYLRTWEGWLYLATVIDAHSRRVIGWAIDEHMRADLVEQALQMAITLRGELPAKVVFHADRGTQGGFNRSSQHPVITEVSNGSSSAGSRSRDASGDEIARGSSAAARGAAVVLDRNRHGGDSGGGGGRGGRVATGRTTVVPQRWRHAALRSDAACRPLSVLS